MAKLKKKREKYFYSTEEVMRHFFPKFCETHCPVCLKPTKKLELFVSCFNCRNRSLLRTTCHFGLKQEIIKNQCKYFLPVTIEEIK